MKTTAELLRDIVEIFATEEELNIINQSKLYKQEKMYSEEDMKIAFNANIKDWILFEEFIEQFKNK